MEKEKKNDYKSLSDLANYLNETKYFKKQWISVKEIIKVFEYLKLFEWNELNKRYEPTKYMLDSHGCFITKSGRILFTDAMWKVMIKKTEDYSHIEWIRWFVDTYNKVTEKKHIILSELHQYLIALDGGKFILCKDDTKNIDELRSKVYKKYGNDNVKYIRTIK